MNVVDNLRLMAEDWYSRIGYNRACETLSRAADEIETARATIAQQAERIEELSFDAAMANQPREIGNHFGLTYMQVWSDTSIASQVIDKMKEQHATIAQQAEQLKYTKMAADEEARRVNELTEQLAAAEADVTRLANDLLAQCQCNVAHQKTIAQLTERINDVAVPALVQAARLIKNPVCDHELIEKAVVQIDAIIAKLKGEASEQRNT